MTALYLFGAFLVVLLAGVVLAPLVESEPPDEELDELPPEERREAAVEALSEVEFEYRTDKLSEEEYRRLRAHYGRIALAAEEATEGDGDGGAAGSAATETAAAPGGGAGAGGPGQGGGSGPRFCPECGTEAPGGARYCPECGERLGDDREEA